YINNNASLPIGQLRSHLRQLSINTCRTLNIHYPNRHLVTLLIHNDYEVELLS
ncbi:hypothetical protein BCV72DRAFT_329990, partial [Rhizopus microsporus var. microsporus]